MTDRIIVNKNYDLYGELPHYFWKDADDVLCNEVHSLFYLQHGGRRTLKSSWDTRKIILKMLANPSMDYAVISWQDSKIEQTVFNDFISSFKRMGITMDKNPLIQCHTPLTGQKYITFTHMGSKQTIMFYSALGKVGTDFNGLLPPNFERGNKWGGIYWYELGLFNTFSGLDITHTESTFIRNAHPKFQIIYEFNTPNLGETTWLMPWVRGKLEKEADFQKNKHKYADLLRSMGFKDGIPYEHLVEYNFSTIQLLKQSEIPKFICPQEMQDIIADYFSDPLAFRRIYLSEEVGNQAICYPHLTPDHFSGKQRFPTYDEYRIGIDVGRNDETVLTLSGVARSANSDMLYIDVGLECWSYDGRNNKNEMIINGEKKPNNKQWDFSDYVNFICTFTAMIKQKYKTAPFFTLNIDYANEGKALYDQWLRYGNPQKIISRREWSKAESEVRIDTFNKLLRIPGCINFVSEKCYMAFRGMKYWEPGTKLSGKRRDDCRDINCDMDTVDAIEYNWDKDQWEALAKWSDSWYASHTHLMSELAKIQNIK